MNILIVGEFSAFAKHLKNGFSLLGHEVTIVQTGDGWKKLGAPDDIMLESKNLVIGGKAIHGTNRFLSFFTNYKVHKQIRNRCPNPDLIIVINYSFLQENFTKIGVSKRYIKRCLDNGAKMIMCECGDSCAGAYHNPSYYKLIGLNTSIKNSRYTFLIKNYSAIIPTCYCYYDDIVEYSKAFGYDIAKISHVIPVPITIDKEFNITSCKERKIFVFHGIIRPASKGTEYIKEAMDRLQTDFPERVECICRGGMPYDEYLKLFECVDILIDQCILNGWGVNAEIGAMKGKCVLTSCGPENAENMGIKEIPFIRIGPDADQIYNELKNLILNPEKIDRLKKASRQFVENYCESRLVAQKYIDIVS